MKKIENTKSKVEEILAKYPECRDSDKRLWITYLTIYHGLRDKMRDTPELAFESFVLTMMDKDTPALESITRVRRKLQADGKYLASEEVQKMRKDNQKETRIWSLDSVA